ncbi:MAG: GGDEF domain-containing phosphodiesterase [Chloroflexota bacterium]|nr:GGDEF domain-containing phosphodiesterase [Chloroflexota bacterium]
MVGLLVHKTGGIKYVFSHTMYIPIILAAYYFRIPGGLIAGIVGGLVLGPFMPISVSTGEMQEVTNWLYRLVFFAGIGVMSGSLFSLSEKRNDKIQWLATHSPDTGLANLNHLISSLEASKRAGKPGSRIALVAVRINNHADITSIFNIEETQALSIKYAHLIHCLLPFDATIFHFFPHTFLFYFNADDFGEELITDVIERKFHHLENPIQINRIPLFFKISVGIAIETIEEMTPTDFFRKANWASHVAAKKNVTYAVYETETDLKTRRTQQLLGDIPRAANQDDFDLYYQPIISISTGEVVGMEALLRWHHPTLGLLMPARFLPYCENTTLVFLIHDWVLKTAIKRLSNWDGYHGDLSINLSTRLLLDMQWIDTLVKLLEAYRVDASRLIFEVTESALIVDQEKSVATLNAIRALGARIAIDDFGMGYSSFQYINMLPVNFLKIDRQFISAAMTSTKSKEIVKSMIGLANSLGIKSIAEGVETKEQLDWLKNEHCDFVQGFLMARPQSGKDIEPWTVSSVALEGWEQNA